MLNDILHLSEEKINNSKIALNMAWEGKSYFETRYESDENDRKIDFYYTSHQGGNGNCTNIGQVCFGFVKLKENSNHWLLITAGEITSIPELIRFVCIKKSNVFKD